MAVTRSAETASVKPESLVSVLGVVYVHQRTHGGGDLYLTRFGLPFADLLQTENWYERRWFEQHRVRLEGTSAVYRVPTKVVGGRRLDLVVKNSRVGEDVPINTHALLEFIHAEFNSPWEEFALVMELRQGAHGPPSVHIRTQEPLAIYVPPERMQIWQSGRSRSKIRKIHARHPGIDLDILRQYKLVYRWIDGENVVDLLSQIGVREGELKDVLTTTMLRAVRHMKAKGYAVADMKPAHIIIDEEDVRDVQGEAQTARVDGRRDLAAHTQRLVRNGRYSVVDYELLLRTEEHDKKVSTSRRHMYLDDMRDRLTATEMPAYLRSVDVFGVPYVHGRVESTGGKLWVIGRNARLFDYFLPERWRGNDSWKLSENNEVYYTLTKDHINIVWKASRVGERPTIHPRNAYTVRRRAYGYNSPFEEFALARFLNDNGIPTIYPRAVYRTGTPKLEHSTDPRRYRSHRGMTDIDGEPILNRAYNYISLRGYFNGPDEWVAAQSGPLLRPMDLHQAVLTNVISVERQRALVETVLAKLANIGCDGSLLEPNDLLMAIDPNGVPMPDHDRYPEVRICNFELVHRW